MVPDWLAWSPLLIAVCLALVSTRVPRQVKWATVLGLALVAAVAVRLWSIRDAERTRSAEQLAGLIPLQGRPGGYVSSDKCEACHPSQYESWHHSFHRTMTQRASPQTILGRFDNVKLELDGKSYQLQRRSDEFWVELEDPEWGIATPVKGTAAGGVPRRAPRVWKRVGLLTGSHHMQVYWIPSAYCNEQIVFPFAWLKEDQRWVPFQQTFLCDPVKPASMHVWNVNCIKCHSTAGQPQIDPQTHLMRTRSGELSIACEACHGPGEAHVAANQNPLRRYAQHWSGRPDPTISNPKRLSARLSSEVCGQCHGIRWTQSQADWQVNGFAYRPGDELDNTSPIVRPADLSGHEWMKERLSRNPSFLEEHYWSDGMVRVSGRDFNGLVEAPCHKRGTLACVSCHSMHQSDPANQLAAGMESNEACLQCHTQMRGKVQEHTHHLASSSGSQCYNCHMPHTVYGLLKAIRSHQIDSPKVQTTLATGRPNACNLCHLDRSLGWTGQFLAEWYHQPAPALTDDQRHIAATVQAVLQGDAGLRALYAYSMGWEPARQASGQRWLVPYLSVLLDDPYSAVRYIAHRSLRTLPGDWKQVPYDFLGPPLERRRSAQQILDRWEKSEAPHLDRSSPEMLIRSDGGLNQEKILQLVKQRDNRSIDLQE
jgi:predicted CXXCH cytochrome family protein